MVKVEIMPPSRPVARRPESTPAAPPRMNPGGLLSSTLIRWEAHRHQRTMTAVAERVRAEADLFDAQSQMADSFIRRQRAFARVDELPEIIGADRARRRAARDEEVREHNNEYELAQMRRAAERANAQALLEDANQVLRAQQEHGYSAYEIAWMKRQCERLDVERPRAAGLDRPRMPFGRFRRSRRPSFPPDAASTRARR
jgi:hypothetical protein